MWQPLPTAHGDGGGIQPESVNRQSLLGTQVRKVGSNVASLTQAIEKNPGNGAERAVRRLE